MYIYIYVYISICMYVHMYLHTNIYIYICTNIYIHIYMHIFAGAVIILLGKDVDHPLLFGYISQKSAQQSVYIAN